MNDTISIGSTVENELKKHRACMAKCLELALAAMNDLQLTEDYAQRLCPADQRQLSDDPMVVFRRTNQLLIAKARLHVFAVLKANRDSNIHSLAVQMRPALECAGQIVSRQNIIISKSHKTEQRLKQHLLDDFVQLVRRTSKMHIDHHHISCLLNRNSVCQEPGTKIRKILESDKVKDLAFGNNWYRHLSRCFYHSEPSALRGASYYGGVGSCNPPADQYAFAQFLDYFTHQMLVMLTYEAVCAAAQHDVAIPNDPRVRKIMELLNSKKAATEHLATTLKAMENRQSR